MALWRGKLASLICDLPNRENPKQHHPLSRVFTLTLLFGPAAYGLHSTNGVAALTPSSVPYGVIGTDGMYVRTYKRHIARNVSFRSGDPVQALRVASFRANVHDLHEEPVVHKASFQTDLASGEWRAL